MCNVVARVCCLGIILLHETSVMNRSNLTLAQLEKQQASNHLALASIWSIYDAITYKPLNQVRIR